MTTLSAHKEALLRAWWEELEFPDDSRASIVIPTDLSTVIGGRRARKQVRAVLREERRTALVLLQALRERQEAAAWWFRYMENPADAELIETLKMTVPRRANESDADYLARLRLIEQQLRPKVELNLRSTYEVGRR